MNWNPIDEGWELCCEVHGLGFVYHIVLSGQVDPAEVEKDAPDADMVNDEGDTDETEVPREMWLVRARGRETYTNDSEAWARQLLTGITKNQFDLFG